MPWAAIDAGWAATLAEALARCGCWGIFAGAILEGETVVLAGGLLVAAGVLDPLPVMLAAAGGAWVGDAACFGLGRWTAGRAIAGRSIGPLGRARRLLERGSNVMLVAYRFCYGLRALLPYLLGAGRIHARRFLVGSALACLLWSGLVTGGAIGLGRAIGAGDPAALLRRGGGFIVAVLVGLWLLKHAVQRCLGRWGGHVGPPNADRS
jgi:membrane protein DedA with SNARE-associated domain